MKLWYACIVIYAQMALDVLQWSHESRDDVNFVLESSKLLFTSATEQPQWRKGCPVKMSPISALLVTLARNGGAVGVPDGHAHDKQKAGLTTSASVPHAFSPEQMAASSPPPSSPWATLQFPKDAGIRQAALLLIREKNSRYSMIRVSSHFSLRAASELQKTFGIIYK